MQLSIRAMLFLTAMVSLLCAALFATPQPWGAGLAMLLSITLLPSILLSGCLFARGQVRAFFLGASLTGYLPCVLPVAVLSISLISDGGEEANFYVQLAYITFWGIVLVAGIAAWGMFHWLRPEEAKVLQGRRPVPSTSQPSSVTIATEMAEVSLVVEAPDPEANE